MALLVGGAALLPQGVAAAAPSPVVGPPDVASATPPAGPAPAAAAGIPGTTAPAASPTTAPPTTAPPIAAPAAVTTTVTPTTTVTVAPAAPSTPAPSVAGPSVAGPSATAPSGPTGGTTSAVSAPGAGACPVTANGGAANGGAATAVPAAPAAAGVATITPNAPALDTPAAPGAPGPATLPGDVIDLGAWNLTLPTGRPGSPDTVDNPQLARFTDDNFRLTPTRDGVAFSAAATGVTTKNSHYPRSELREMNGTAKAAWSNTTGTHTLDVCEAFTKLPTAKPEVVGAQIHDGNDDVLQVRLEGTKLVVQYADGKAEALLDPDYRLGTPYEVRIVAAGGRVGVLYNGVPKAELPLSGSGWYWKVGAYVQSNPTKGDGAGSVGEVVVYSLGSVHA